MYFDTHSFGCRLKEERERLGLSQQSAADICGVRREMWGKYERDVAEPGVRVMELFSAHGADALYVLTGRREPNIKAVTEGFEGTVNPARLALITRELTYQFERQGLHADLFKGQGDVSGEVRCATRIAFLVAEIYNELFLHPPAGLVQDVIRNLAYGMILAERSRLRGRTGSASE